MKYRLNFSLSNVRVIARVIARIIPLAAIVALAGCVSYGRTGVLVTPFSHCLRNSGLCPFRFRLSSGDFFAGAN